MRKPLFLFTRSLLATATAAALASDARAWPSQATDATEDPVVTSPRVEKLLGEVPAAVSLIPQREIQRGEPQISLDEPLARVPGVFLQNRRNFAQDLRIAIRGFGARSNFGIRGVRVLVDGIPATLPDGQTQLDHVDLGSAQRIEVIRGPSSSLYGPSAGGVLSIESQDGTTPPTVSGRVAFGDYGYRRFQAKAAGRAGNADYLVSLSRFEIDGYRDHSRSENILLNTKFGLTIDETSDLDLVVNVVHSPVADDPGGLRLAEVRSDRRQAAPNNRLFDAGESVDQQQFGFVYHKEIGEHHQIEINNFYSWRQFDNRLPFRNGGSVDLDRFFTGGGLRYLYADTVFGRDNRLLLGVEVDAQRDVRKRFDNDEGVHGALVFDQDERVTGVGVYAQNEYRLTRELELTLGLRYDRIEFDVDDGFPADGNDGGRVDFEHVSPRAGLLYAPHPRVHLFANVSTSFETPTTTELANPDGSGGFDPDLDPQTSVGYEIGMKGGVPGRLWYELVGFYIDVDDELVPFEIPGQPGRSFFENAGSSRRGGLELFATVQPLDGLTASLSYTFSHFEFRRFRTAAGSFDGNDLPGVPRNQVWAELAYEHPCGLYGSWDVSYADHFYADNANSVRSDAYVVSNLRAGYLGHFGPWEIGPFLGLDNLFGEEYADNVRLNAGFGRSFEPAPKFNLYGGFSLGFRFGGPSPAPPAGRATRSGPRRARL